MKRKTFISLVLGIATVNASVTALAADSKFHLKEDNHGVEITVDGKPFASYVIDQVNKPYLWPVYGPTGKAMTRAFPMQDVPTETKTQRDHYHHRGIVFGHESIGGADTWTERGTHEPGLNNPKVSDGAQKRLDLLGNIKHLKFTELKADSDNATVAETCEYVDPKGKRLLTEERRLTFRSTSEIRSVDFDQDFIASEGEISFDDRKDAGLSIRVPASMAVDSKEGGRIVNSDGVTDKDAWSKAAKWCDYNGPVEGEHLGVAFLNHPSSFAFPTHWHVRTYGLFTANPFASNQYDKGRPVLTTTLKAGERLKLRHRFVFHKGDEKSANVAALFDAYSKETK
jgi:Methane oxygenase PmoA